MQNFGNFQTHFDYLVDIEYDNLKPKRIQNIDLEQTNIKFEKLLQPFKSSKILIEYIDDMNFLYNYYPCPFKITRNSYEMFQKV